MYRSLWRVFKLAVQNTFRNFWLSVITVSMYILTLATINVVIFVNLFAGSITQDIEEKVEVTAYFSVETSLEIAQAARGYIAGFPQVRVAEIVTADEAYEEFLAASEGDESVLLALDEIGDNPFGHALVITANEVADFPFILETLGSSQYAAYIDETDEENNQALIENITNFSQGIQYAGLALAVFFGLVTFLILFNTIRMAIYVHREEIGIMKLVGASDAFVRAPFLIEGFLYSTFACLVFFIALSALLRSGVTLPSWFGDTDAIDLLRSDFSRLMLIEFCAAIGVAFLATWTAMTRHLKV